MAAEIRLFFQIVGDAHSQPFSLPIERSIDISTLKRVIYAYRPFAFQGIIGDVLAIYPVRVLDGLLRYEI